MIKNDVVDRINLYAATNKELVPGSELAKLLSDAADEIEFRCLEYRKAALLVREMRQLQKWARVQSGNAGGLAETLLRAQGAEYAVDQWLDDDEDGYNA